MNRTHGALTVALPVKEDAAGDLRKKLKELNRPQGPANFDKAATVLFVSGVILPAQDYFPTQGNKNVVHLPETFLLATTYWGPLSRHLDNLVETHRNCLMQIFQHCHPSPQPGCSEDQLKQYLTQHSHASTFSSRYQCMTKDDVTREKELRDEIQRYLCKAQALDAFDSLTALQIKTLIQRHIRIHEDRFAWAFKPAKGVTLAEFWILHHAKLIAPALILLADWFLFKGLTWPCFIGKAALWNLAVPITIIAGWMWLIARQRNPTAPRPPDERVRMIAASQLHPVLNEMTAAVPLKSGRLRRWFYSVALLAVRTFIKTQNIPTVSSIRWLVIDKGRRLVFLSNFSNSTDFYVRDFVNGWKTYFGINFMFTNGTHFPDARLLFLSGIKADPEGYMNAVHTGQHVTDCWYAHEPMLTQDIIKKFRRLRNGLFREMDEEEANKWLKLL